MKFQTTFRSGTFTLVSFLLSSLMLSSNSEAALFNFLQLDSATTDPLFNALAAGLAFKPVEPASSLGKIFGLQLGVQASAVNIASISNTLEMNSYLPTADLQAGFSIPFGFTFEFGFFPTISVAGTSFSKFGGALKWTATNTVLKMLPFDLALRTSYTNASLSTTQSIEGGDIAIGYDSKMYGAQLLLSKNLRFLEPYFGIGAIKHSSSLTGNVTANFMGTTFPLLATGFSGSTTSTWIQAGLLLKAVVVGIAGEYNYIFGYSTYAGKFSFRF